MAIDNKIIDEKVQYDINRKQNKYQQYHQINLTNRNILQVTEYYLLIKVE